MDLRRWGEVWYYQLKLPEAYETLHVVECRYTGWEGKGQRKFKMECKLFSETVTLTVTWCTAMAWSAYELQT